MKIAGKHQAYIVTAAAISGSLLYFYFDPELSVFFPPCPLHHFTGLFCPGCGSQRAFHDLVHGNVLQAAEHNLLFVVFLPLLFLAAAIFLADAFFRKKLAARLFHSVYAARIILIVIVVFWLLRNIPVAPFSWLAP